MANKAKKERRDVKFADEETEVTQPERSGSDSSEDVSDNFLAKREKNIKDNKAMVT